LPCLLVISNDIFAYIFGILYGKTRLIELSPKKTVEGFIGGMISTFFFAFFVNENKIFNFDIKIVSSRGD